MSFEGFSNIFTSALTLLFGIVVIVLPIGVFLFINKNYLKLEEPYFLRRYSSLYEGINLESKVTA